MLTAAVWSAAPTMNVHAAMNIVGFLPYVLKIFGAIMAPLCHVSSFVWQQKKGDNERHKIVSLQLVWFLNIIRQEERIKLIHV
mmetsp:Transcript_30021/g.72858  ORF Transcript_30021/g.72858 Transcript_30021/m.72858 type:complete len:83 (-) Transcript_30021:781-1029(-)